MPYQSSKGLSYFQFGSFERLPVEHAVFTRQGGVSPAPWDSLNVGGTVGDDEERVRTNRARVFDAMLREVSSAHDVWQVHSSNYVIANEPRDGNEYIKADILLSTNPDVTLFMRFADCVPIMLYDPRQHAIALAHAGWLGTVRGVALNAVRAMEKHFGSNAGDLMAGLGPSIGPDHYEVGHDVRERFQLSFPGQGDLHFREHDHRLYLDLWAANEFQLRSLGVKHIDTAGICTACDVRRWYSHRAESGTTGRFGALLALNA